MHSVELVAFARGRGRMGQETISSYLGLSTVLSHQALNLVTVRTVPSSALYTKLCHLRHQTIITNG